MILAKSSRSPLKAAEILQHPQFGHTTLELVPRLKGKVAVAKGRGGPFNIAYEVHGDGSRHLIVWLPFCMAQLDLVIFFPII